jgi:hypothetical protein
MGMESIAMKRGIYTKASGKVGSSTDRVSISGIKVGNTLASGIKV